MTARYRYMTARLSKKNTASFSYMTPPQKTCKKPQKPLLNTRKTHKNITKKNLKKPLKNPQIILQKSTKTHIKTRKKTKK
jgi:hypothetical protein